MNYVEVAVPFFIFAMGIEYLYGLLSGRQTYRLNDTVNSLSLGVLSRLVDVLKLSFSAAVFAGLVSLLSIQPWKMESAWQWVFAFVAYDCCYYWKHRFGHTSRLFWASHVAHHQSEEFNLSTALRQTGTDYLGFVFYLPLFLIGVPAYVVVTVGSLNLIYQFWVHTEHVRRLGPLEWFFVTPSNHRVHHARNPQYLDKNFGGVFIVWDRLFGSYQDELDEEPCVYGTVVPLASWNPIWANFHVWIETAKISWRTQRWQDKFLVWFKPPGWQPKDFPQKTMEGLVTSKFNPMVATPIKVYAFIQFWVITGLSLWLLDGYETMPRLFGLLLFVWFCYSLYTFGQALENKKQWYKLELSRVLLGSFIILGWMVFWRDSQSQQLLTQWIVVLSSYGGFCLIVLFIISWQLNKSNQNLASGN